MPQNSPITIRFATDTAAAKSGMQDLAASVAGNLVKISGVMAQNVEAVRAAANANGGYAATAKTVAASVVSDFGKIGQATIKAANDHNGSVIGMGAAVLKAASDTKTGSAVLSAAWAGSSAGIAAQARLVKNEASAAWSVLAASPAVSNILTLAGGFGALLAVLKLTDMASEAAQARLSGLVKIATQAEGAGVGTTFLQGWLGQARDLNVEVGKLEGMLTRARVAATVKLGEGETASHSEIGEQLDRHVQAGNLSKGDIDRYDGAKDQEARIRVVLDLIDELQAKGAKLAAYDIGGKMFGPDFETKLRSGVNIVGQMRTALDGLKVAGGQGIVPPEEIERAKQITAEFNRASDTLALALLPVMKDIHEWEQKQLADWAGVYDKIVQVVAGVLQLYDAVKKVGDAIDKMTGANPMGSLATWLGADKVHEWLVAHGLPEFEKPYGAPDEASRNKAGGAAEKPTELPGITASGDTSNRLPARHPKQDAEGLSEIENYLMNLQRANDLAQAELRTVGLTSVERAKALEIIKAEAVAKKEGRDLTDEERAKVLSLAAATQTAKDRAEDLRGAMARTAEGMREFGDMANTAMTDLLVNGRSANEVFANLAKQLASQSLRALLTGQGPLAGFFGTATKPSDGPNAVGGLWGMLAGQMGYNPRTGFGGAGAGTSAAGGTGATGAGLISQAASMVGLSETKDRTQLNGFLKTNGVNMDVASDAWCAGFVNANLKSMGIQGSGSQMATSFMNWGSPVTSLAKVQAGDVLVEPRGRALGQAGGHVGLATGATRTADDGSLEVEMISGNYSNQVKRSWEDASSLVGRRGISDVAGDATKSVGDLSNKVGDLSSAAGDVTKPLGDLSKDIGDLGSAANSAASGSGGGGGGGLFGLLGSLFKGGGGGGSDQTMWLADGGHVHGPGSGTSDSIPAWLSTGEFVINADATAKNLPLLHAINSGRVRVPRFASGGLVAGNLTGGADGRMMSASVDNRRSFNIDARGAQTGVGEQIVAALTAYDADLNRTWGQRSADYRLAH